VAAPPSVKTSCWPPYGSRGLMNAGFNFAIFSNVESALDPSPSWNPCKAGLHR
jgi:hypothetical protein